MPSRSERDDSLLRAIEAAESDSYGSGGYSMDGELATQRAEAIDAYLGKNTKPAPEGNSQVVSRDLFDTIEWIKPSLVRIFAGGDEVVKFNPVGPEDEMQARQESLYVNHLVTKRNQWSQIFHDWCTDALLTKNAYCMAYYDKQKVVEYEVYEEQSDDAFALLMQDADDIEILEHSQEVDEDELKKQQAWYERAMQQYQMAVQQMQVQASMAQQQPGLQGVPPPPPQMPPPPEMPPTPYLHTVKLRRTEDEGKICLRVLPPERCVIHHTTPTYTLAECDFFEYWEEMTISKLRQMGFDVDDDIASPGYNEGWATTVEDTARNRFNDHWLRTDGVDAAMRPVVVRMCWIRHDYDGDGIAELQYCVVVGDTILFRQEASRIPVSSIVATPIPHRHIGISIADVMMEIQETKQAMLRQGIDNLFHANNPRLFMADGKINLDDALVSRPGGVVRSIQGTDTVFGRDIAPIVIPNIFPQAVQGMEYMDRISERRTGVNGVFTGNVSSEVLTQTTGMAMNQMGTAAAQKVEQIARMISPSVEYLFQCVHELVLKHGHKEEVVNLAGEWVVVNPSQWRKREDLTIAVGLGSGNKDTVLAHLNMLFQQQMALLPMGVTDPSLIYNTVSEIAKTAGFGAPGMFWKKPPAQLPPPPPPPEAIKAQADMQKAQFQAQQEQQKFVAESQIEQQKQSIQVSEKEKDRQTQIELAKMAEATKLAIAQMQIEAQKESQQQKMAFDAQSMSANQDFEMKKTGAMPKEEAEARDMGMMELLANLQQALAMLNDSISRPRVAVRDPKTNRALYGRPMTDEEMARINGTMQ